MSTPTKDLKVTLIQADTRWHDPAGNRKLYGDLVRAHANGADLVVLPETFTSGFTNETVGNAETMAGESVKWFQALAKDVGSTLTGSMVIKDGERFYNRLFWMRPDGSHETYDKRHLFRMANEHERYACGTSRTIVEIAGWRVMPLVCYDLRFPVWSRNRHDGTRFDYDAILYVANWPSPRHYAWQTLLRARAMENLAYCLGVNRVGSDGNNLSYLGGSVALDYLGQPIVECGAQPQAVTTTLHAEPLKSFRARFPTNLDADSFRLEA
jgi:omega-amidase